MTAFGPALHFLFTAEAEADRFTRGASRLCRHRKANAMSHRLAQTLADREYQAMRDDPIRVLEKIGVATGGAAGRSLQEWHALAQPPLSA